MNIKNTAGFPVFLACAALLLAAVPAQAEQDK